MRLDGIQTGDIVEIDRLGRRFHAIVTDSAPGGLSVLPLDRRVTYRTCRAHEVIAHWAKRGRPQAANDRPQSSPRQLEFETLDR